MDIFGKIILNKQIPEWVSSARENKKDYEALVLGKDFTNLLQKIEKRENDKQIQARKKYSKNIIDVLVRVLRPLDNVYSASGSFFDVNTKKEKKEYLKLRANIREGLGLTQWLGKNWSKKLYNTDPCGLLMYEFNENKNPYLTYKNIDSIRNYETDGLYVKWVLFEPKIKEEKKYWRYIDNEKDYTIIELSDNVFEIINEETYKNLFSVVPASIISDIEQFGTQERLPFIHNIIELLKEYLRDKSIKTIFKQLMGFPIFWRYGIPCNKCKGTGKYNAQDCPECDGFGFYISKDIVDAVLLPIPTQENQLKLAPDIAGYVVPPIEIWEQYNLELKLIEELSYRTLYGYDNNIQSQKTQIEVISNKQPVINALNDFSDTAEKIDEVLSNILCSYVYKNGFDKNIAIVNYGRNFILESTADILNRYHENKKNYDSSSVLDRDINEWVYVKYKNNPIKLENELKRLKIEPYIHYSLNDVKTTLGDVEAQKKILFVEFWKKADKNKSEEVLEKEFINYLNEKRDDIKTLQKIEPV